MRSVGDKLLLFIKGFLDRRDRPIGKISAGKIQGDQHSHPHGGEGIDQIGQDLLPGRHVQEDQHIPVADGPHVKDPAAAVQSELPGFALLGRRFLQRLLVERLIHLELGHIGDEPKIGVCQQHKRNGAIHRGFSGSIQRPAAAR
ncbi:hypothetical protein D3C73_1181600 [compost metagenome]